MAEKISPSQIKQAQYVYATSILAKLATEATETIDSARGLDEFVGFIDSTNTQKNTHLTTEAFRRLISEVPELVEDCYFNIDVEGKMFSARTPVFNWRSLLPLRMRSGPESSDLNVAVNWSTTPSHTLVQEATTEPDSDQSDRVLALYAEFVSELFTLERNIPEAIRNPVRERLRFLLDASVEEENDEQDLLNMSSARSLYGFLGLCQCQTVPSLTLTWEGHVYAQWRESVERSINARFVNNSRVDYVIRNFPERFSGTSSPARFLRLLDSLGLDSLINTESSSPAT